MNGQRVKIHFIQQRLMVFDEMLIKLLEAGAKVNAYCYWNDRDWKCTALHLAALSNKTFCVKVLIRNGADENMKGNCK